MTPADLIGTRACTARCLLAPPASRCRCACRGEHHGALLDVDITTLIDGRRRGLRHLTDLEVLTA